MLKRTEKHCPRYLAIADVCEITTLSRATILRYIEAGRLPATKLSRKILVKESDVMALLDKHTVIRK